MKQSEERRLLVNFNKIMTQIAYSGADMPQSVKDAFLKIDWDTSTIVQLRMGANDMLEMTQDLQGENLSKIDDVLRKYEAATITQLRDKSFKKVIQLLSKKQVTKEEDVFLLKGILDSNDERFTETQLDLAQSILDSSVQP